MTAPLTLEVIILAGGCFWGVEDLLHKVPGVHSTVVGYTGGITKNPMYEQVKKGDTGHAEAVKVEFDPKKISLKDLLVQHFFKLHDPTQKDRQQNDKGTQYRSVIFYANDAQKKTAEEAIADVTKRKWWKNPIVTQVLKASEFWPAEDYHQDYLLKNPNGYTCHFYRSDLK